MAMPNRLARWTTSELHRLPDDGNRYELVDGTLFVTPPPTYEHETLVAVLNRLLSPYVVAHDLGHIYFPRSVIHFGEKDEVEPDMMVRPVPIRRPTSWATAPLPILVVEVLSETTRRRDRIGKRGLYVEEGIPEYWIVDGDERVIRVVRPGFEDSDSSTQVVWSPSGASAPFRLDVAGFFRAALGG